MMLRVLWRFLVIAGRAFEATRVAKVRIGRRTLLAHLFWLVSAFLPSPERIKVFWNDTMYLSKRSAFELLILGENAHSRGSTAVFQQRVRPGMTVVDVGANIGYYTLLAAKLVGETGRVYAFEPEPENYALLVKNVEVNGYRNVVCLRQAVSNKSGKASLFVGAYSVSHSLSSFAGVDPTHSLLVETTSLDEFFRKEGWPRTLFIKMNIDGWEWFALRGMTKILSRSKHLKMMLEFDPDLVRKIGVEPTAFLQRLQDMGFTIQVIDEKKGLQPLNDLTLHQRRGGNILCEQG